MKIYLLYTLALTFSLSAYAQVWDDSGPAHVPVCKQIEGTTDLAWFMSDYPIPDRNCLHEAVKCEQIGTPSEGWYKHAKRFVKELGSVQCASAPTPPVCVNVGTSSEGWALPDGSIVSASCSGQVAECVSPGTRSEGWMSVLIDPNPIALLAQEKCSK